MIRFIFFIFLFALIFAFVGKWIYIFIIKKLKDKESNFLEAKYQDLEFEARKCRRLASHNFKNFKKNTKCKWCGVKVQDAFEEEKKREL